MPTEKASEIEERDSELENTVGIIFVADYQTNKARNKLAHKIHPIIPLEYHRKTRNSTHIFKCNGKCYRISLEVEHLGSSSNMTNGAKMRGFQSIFGKYVYLPFPHPLIHLISRRFS
jgi:hypothetical protein